MSGGQFTAVRYNSILYMPHVKSCLVFVLLETIISLIHLLRTWCEVLWISNYDLVVINKELAMEYFFNTLVSFRLDYAFPGFFGALL